MKRAVVSICKCRYTNYVKL